MRRLFSLSILLVVPIALAACGGGGGGTSGGTPPLSSFSWEVQTGASAADLQGMKAAVLEVISQHPINVQPGQEMRFRGVSVSGNWAVTEGQLASGEGITILVQKIDGNWQAAYPGTPDFEEWVDQVPNALIAPETKQLLK